MRATKVVCTLGPATQDRLPELIAAGMDVARINCSHGTREDHRGLLEGVRAASAEAGRPIGVMADLSGPKVRLRALVGGEARLEEGSRFVLGGDEPEGTAAGAPTTHPGLASDLEPGDRVLLADGAVVLRVLDTSDGLVTTEVVRGATIRSRAGVNVPSERLGLPAIGPKDEADASWAIEAGVDMIAQSFVRRAADVSELRSLIGPDGPLLIAKIETRAAVDDLSAILQVADAIMVARGDLGVEAALAEIPVLQRRILNDSVLAGLPVIVATQMLESMIRAPFPTRAEVTDVAAAVFEGADAVMLSAETAVGDFPLESAAAAARVAEVAETDGAAFLRRVQRGRAQASDPHAIADAAAEIAREGGAVAVACFTSSGRTATLLSAAQPRVPILALSPSPRVLSRLTLYRGVLPVPSEAPQDTDAMFALMERTLVQTACARAGEAVVMVASAPFGRGPTNLLKVHRIGGALTGRSRPR